MFLFKLREGGIMSISRIKAILLQEYFISIHSLEVVIDLFYFSLATVVVFGFFTTFLSQKITSNSAFYFLLGIILWEIIRVNQYSISVGALWNVWSRNLSNMFVAPLSTNEYLVAAMISGFMKSLVIFLTISILASTFFHFNIFRLGFANLFLFFINLTVFAWSLGFFILGFIFRFGTRIQALAWGAIFLLQPLTASVFPLEILPKDLVFVAKFFPATYVFEAARRSLDNPSIHWNLLNVALIENVIYFIISLAFFSFMFRKSRNVGQFAKNEQ